MSGGAAKVLSGPAGYAVVIVVGIGALYLTYNYVKGQGKAAVDALTPGPAPGQSWGNYLFGISDAPAPDPNANANMGGVDFGVIPGLNKGW